MENTEHVREIIHTQIVEEAPKEEEPSAMGMNILSKMLAILEEIRNHVSVLPTMIEQMNEVKRMQDVQVKVTQTSFSRLDGAKISSNVVEL